MRLICLSLKQYICENHFQRISNKSLFTGLKAINHFGRPDIAALLQQVQNKHSRVSTCCLIGLLDMTYLMSLGDPPTN